MGKKKKRTIILCFFLFLLFAVIQTAGSREFASEAVLGYYDGLMEGFFPAYRNKSQPVYGTVLSRMIRTYREEVNPLLQYSSDYRKTTGEDLVSGEYYYFEDDEDSDKSVEEMAEGTETFNLKQWENPSYLRKYIYQIDSTTMVTNSEINGKELLNMDLSLKKTDSPQVLIYHTHGSEQYKDSRQGKKEDTVIGVGDELARKLKEKGISVIHDRNVYDMRNGTVQGL